MSEPCYVIDAATAAGTGFRVTHASAVVLRVLSVSGVLELFERG